MSPPKPEHEQLTSTCKIIKRALNQNTWTDNHGKALSFKKGGGAGELQQKAPAPDQQIWVPSISSKPFLVMEVANSQSPQNLRDKINLWLRAYNDIRIICVLAILPYAGPPPYRVEASIIKPKRKPVDGGPPSSFTYVSDYILRDVVVYPERTPETFRISLPEVVRNHRSLDDYPVQARSREVQVPLDAFYDIAETAVGLKAHPEVPQEKDPNYVAHESPVSGRSLGSSGSSTKDDEEADPTYKPLS
ncbi:MAG: hypothetical protein Q9220_007500 [cf. Caloplaca sp. 1 TL-2023]